jgi:hypothetical protein
MSINEKLFRIAADHLVSQGAMSANEYGTCAYRGVSGRMCAIGVLINNDFYDPEIEGTSISGYPEDEVLSVVALSHNVDEKDIDVEMLRELQYIHDSQAVYNWDENLMWVSDRYGYNWKPNWKPTEEISE